MFGTLLLTSFSKRLPWYLPPGQHHLFSTVTFLTGVRGGTVLQNRTRPRRVCRHVRALKLIKGRLRSPLVADVLKTPFPHPTSFQNLHKLEVHRVDLGLAPLDVLGGPLEKEAGEDVTFELARTS